MALTKVSYSMITGAPVNVLDFGAVGDGVADDTVAIQAAVTAAVGAPILLGEGKTYKITSQISSAVGVWLYGGGTILVDFAGIAFSISGGQVAFENVNFDGNAKAIGVTALALADSISVQGCDFFNFYSITYATPLSIVDADVVEIIGNKFRNLTALANGTQGDTNGSVRAIYVSGAVRVGVISGNRFETINSVNGLGVKVFEDADAIQCAPLAGKYQNISISNNYFRDVGKRFAKLQGLTDSVYEINNNTFISGWVGTTDTVGAVDNGMFNDIECFGGTLTVVGNTHVGGVSGALVVVSTASMQRMVVSNNIHTPEYHQYVQGSRTRFIQGVSLSATFESIVSNNTCNNCYYGLDGLGATQIITGNHLTTYAASILTTGAVTLVGSNTIELDAASTVTTAVGVQIENGATRFAVTGNVIRGWNDGVNIAAQSGSYLGVVSANTIQTISRDAIRNSANAAFLSMTGNITDDLVSPGAYHASNHTFYVNGSRVAGISSSGTDIALLSYTAANIASAANAVNTTNKRAGLIVYDTTNNRIMISSGALAVSPWYVADGSASVVPV